MMSFACRAVFGFLAGLMLWNLVGGLVAPGLDAAGWLIDLRPLPHALTRLVLLAGALGLGVSAVRRPWGMRLRLAACGALLVLLAFALRNTLRFYALVSDGSIRAAVPVPLSILTCLVLGLAAYRAARPQVDASLAPWRTKLTGASAAAGLLILGIPLSQMLFFGTTDYRRRADAAVVFGARAYADGSPSDALADRVRTGCELYHQRLVSKLVFSGGPGDGAVHETESMRRMALALGVANDAILLDTGGVNTLATVRNTDAIFEREGIQTVLAVSHAYHLPRVKMCYQRHGRDVRTVPAEPDYVLRAMPFLVLREAVATWVYFFCPVIGTG